VTERQSTAARFRALHTAGSPLVLVNAWDAASARVVAAAGAPAIATTSAGVAWSLGFPDGGALARDRATDLVARIAGAARVPVTADIEDGYGATPDEVAGTVRAVLAAGAVGVNIEDADHAGAAALRTTGDQCARLAAARAAGGTDLFVNARIDTYLSGGGDLADTLARAAAYLDAGADGVFVPGVTDPALIATLVGKIPAPLNIMTGPGGPTVAELAALGVARVSTGSAVAEAAYSVAHRAAREAYTTGTWTTLTTTDLDFGTVNRLLTT
jgi:2-methylisocitrate lyase-like PEP mutase family enzyme